MADKQRMRDISEIGKTIADIRKTSGMTQQVLADKVFEGMTTISKIEKGRRPNLSVDLLQRIAGALGVSMNDLCYAAPDSLPSTESGVDQLTNEAISILQGLSPEDKAAAIRMLRGLADRH